MVALGQRFTHSFLLALKFLSVYEQRSTLPQSRIRSTAPSEREPGIGAHHSSGCSLKSGVGGRFSSPLRNSKTVSFYHSSNDTPSVTPFGRDSSLREGAGKRSHSSYQSENPGLAGGFHRPYETQKPFPFTIHRTALPQSRPLGVPAPSGREPGNVPIHRAGRKIRRCGRFSSPLRDSEVGAFYHSVRCWRLSLL